MMQWTLRIFKTDCKSSETEEGQEDNDRETDKGFIEKASERKWKKRHEKKN